MTCRMVSSTTINHSADVANLIKWNHWRAFFWPSSLFIFFSFLPGRYPTYRRMYPRFYRNSPGRGDGNSSSLVSRVAVTDTGFLHTIKSTTGNFTHTFVCVKTVLVIRCRYTWCWYSRNCWYRKGVQKLREDIPKNGKSNHLGLEPGTSYHDSFVKIRGRLVVQNVHYHNHVHSTRSKKRAPSISSAQGTIISIAVITAKSITPV